jgi:hypothetical protein
VRQILRLESRSSKGVKALPEIARDLFEYSIRKDLSVRVTDVLPPPGPTPDYFDHLITYQKIKTARMIEERIKKSGSPMFKGHMMPDYSSLWDVFFYRFVNPESRLGPNLNYADRARQGRTYPAGRLGAHSCPSLSTCRLRVMG